MNLIRLSRGSNMPPYIRWKKIFKKDKRCRFNFNLSTHELKTKHTLTKEVVSTSILPNA